MSFPSFPIECAEWTTAGQGSWSQKLKLRWRFGFGLEGTLESSGYLLFKGELVSPLGRERGGAPSVWTLGALPCES